MTALSDDVAKRAEDAATAAYAKHKPSARKSFGKFKAVIVHPNGRTEILGQRVVPLVWIPKPGSGAGMVPMPDGPTKNVRGKVYDTHEEAIAAAQRQIDAWKQSLLEKFAMPRMRAIREQHGLPSEIGGSYA